MPKQTAIKAHVTGAVVALATFFLSLGGVVDAPPIVDTANAIQPLLNALVEAGVTGALMWVTAYFASRNEDKPARPPMGSVLAHPFATLTALLLALSMLAGCDPLSTAERLTLVNNTIESAARVTETALAQGHIDVATACKVEVHGRLARAAVDAGFESTVLDDAEGAAGHLRAAQAILSGLSTEAAAQVARECN